MGKLMKNDLRWIMMILEGDMRECKNVMAENSSFEISDLEMHLLELRVDRCQQIRDKLQGILDAESKRIEVG